MDSSRNAIRDPNPAHLPGRPTGGWSGASGSAPTSATPTSASASRRLGIQIAVLLACLGIVWALLRRRLALLGAARRGRGRLPRDPRRGEHLLDRQELPGGRLPARPGGRRRCGGAGGGAAPPGPARSEPWWPRSCSPPTASPRGARWSTRAPAPPTPTRRSRSSPTSATRGRGRPGRRAGLRRPRQDRAADARTTCSSYSSCRHRPRVRRRAAPRRRACSTSTASRRRSWTATSTSSSDAWAASRCRRRRSRSRSRRTTSGCGGARPPGPLPPRRPAELPGREGGVVVAPGASLGLADASWQRVRVGVRPQDGWYLPMSQLRHHGHACGCRGTGTAGVHCVSVGAGVDAGRRTTSTSPPRGGIASACWAR